MLPETATQMRSLGALGHAERTTDTDARYFRVKRCVDVVLALGLLLILWPVILIIALLVTLDSPGSVLFVQERVGAKRHTHANETSWEIRNFRFYKFRSMIPNADPSIHANYIKAWAEGNADAKNCSDQGPKFKLVSDNRITRVGKFLRKSSLDELPQIFNILKGDMSFVGPRPVPVYEAMHYRDWHFERLHAVPGLTGLWQVEGRGEVSFEEMIKMDIAYVRSQSLKLDTKIILKTIPVVLAGAGAR